MSNAKFYVLGGGRWRELDTSAGRVEGWGGARFLYVERGRLRAVRRAPVLRGLRALAAGRALAVHDGAPLSQIRFTDIVKDKLAPCSSCERRARCLYAHCGCGASAPCGSRPPPARPEHPALPAPPALHALPAPPALHTLPAPPALQAPPAPGVQHAAVQANLAPPPAALSVPYQQQNNKIKKQLLLKEKQAKIAVVPSNKVRPTSSDEDLSASIMEWNRKRKLREIRGAELCKELIISEEDVVILRNYIEKDDKNVFKVDLERFDADDTYKSKVFYKLNPLVNVERCKAIADMTWEQRSQSTVTLKDFITNLGLRRIDDPSPSRSSYRMRKRQDIRKLRGSEGEQDKENLTTKRQLKVKKRPNKVLVESADGKPNSDKVKGEIKVSEVPSRATRGSRRLEESAVVEVSDDETFVRTESAEPRTRAAGGAREYSAAEDAAIVRWLRAAGRAQLVNGNRLWRQLQPEHQRLTGHFRSWHSLRNRYLRYLLPALGELLPASAAAALRAAAARGVIKARPLRRHSLLALPPVTSAWARRPRPARGDGRRDDNGTETTRSLRSDATSALTNSRVETPTYSELTRRFAERHRSTPNSDVSEVTEPEKIERRASKRLRAVDDSYIRLDDVSSNRRLQNTSDRRAQNSSNNDTPGSQTARSSTRANRSCRRYAEDFGRHTNNTSQTTDSIDRRKHRTRRLYNPNI